MNPGFLLTLLWSLLMASSFVVSAWISQFASPVAVTFLRFLLALIIMTPFYFYSGGRISSLFGRPREWLPLLTVSGCLVGFFVCLFTALTTTTSLNTSVLYTLVPIIGATVSRLLGIRTALIQWLGFVLGSTGAMSVLLVASGSAFHWHCGDAVYLLGCLLLACHVVSAQHWCAAYSPFGGAYRIMLFGTLWLVPVALFSGQLMTVQWATSAFWEMLGYLTLATTLLTFVLQQRIIITAGAGRLLGASYVIPVWVAVYVAWNSATTVLFSVGFITGTLLIIIAQWLIAANHRKQEKRHGQIMPDTPV